jgi:hypothetical protein
MSLDWPPHLDRTPENRRDSGRQFDTDLSDAFDHLEKQLRLLGVDGDEYRYGFDAQARQTDKRPYARASPDDPGFAVYWKLHDQQYVVACDQYAAFPANVRAVGLWMEENRMTEQRPVATTQSQFAAALPPGDANPAAVSATEPPHDVLEVAPDASDTAVMGAARRLKAKFHPDSGDQPDEQQFKRVCRAEEAMLDG